MAGETQITVIGNLTSDPELRYTQGGLAVANFTIASTPRNFDRDSNEWKDGEALFLRASVWKEFAEHVAGSLHKGTRVIAQGRLKQRSYETKEGEKRTSIELEIDEIGPSLRYATASVTRANDGAGGQRAPQGQQQGGYAQQAQPQQGYAQPPQQGYAHQPPQQQPQGAPQPNYGQAQQGYGQATGGYAQQGPGQPQNYPQGQPAQQTQDVWATPGQAAPYDSETPF